MTKLVFIGSAGFFIGAAVDAPGLPIETVRWWLLSMPAVVAVVALANGIWRD